MPVQKFTIEFIGFPLAVVFPECYILKYIIRDSGNIQ